MIEPLADTWHSRDLPVLRTVVRMYDEELRPIAAGEVMAETGLTDRDITRAGMALRQAGLVDVMIAVGPAVLRFGSVTAEARRLAGSWPSPDNIADRLLAALADIAEHGSDELTKSRARKAAEALGGFSRDTLIAVIGSAAGVAMQ